MHVGLLAHVCSCMWGYLHMYVHACGATCTCMSRCIEFRSLMLGSSTVVLPFVYWVRAFSEPRACLNILARLPVLMLIQHPLDPNHQPPARPHSCVAVVILRTNLMLVQHTLHYWATYLLLQFIGTEAGASSPSLFPEDWMVQGLNYRTKSTEEGLWLYPNLLVNVGTHCNLQN